MYYKFIRENVYFYIFSKKFVEENKINPILINVKFNDVIKSLDYRNKYWWYYFWGK